VQRGVRQELGLVADHVLPQRIADVLAAHAVKAPKPQVIDQADVPHALALD